MFNIGFQEMMLILILALIIFGPKSLPDMARKAGKFMGEMRKTTDDLVSQFKETTKPLEDAKASVSKIAEPIQEIKSAAANPTAYVGNKAKENLWDNLSGFEEKGGAAAPEAQVKTQESPVNDALSKNQNVKSAD